MEKSMENELDIEAYRGYLKREGTSATEPFEILLSLNNPLVT